MIERLRMFMAASEIDVTYFLVTEIESRLSINNGWSNGDPPSAESFANPKLPAFIAYPAPILDFPNMVGRSILNRRKPFREGSRTNAVSACRYRHIQRFMGSIGII